MDGEPKSHTGRTRVAHREGGATKERFNITERFTESLTPPRKGNVIYYDETLKGFGVRITAGGAISFTLRYSLNGRERCYTIGRYPELSAKKARAEAEDLRADIRKGKDPLGEREQQQAEGTIAELVTEYLGHVQEKKRGETVRSYRQCLSHLLPKLGRLRVTSLTRGDLERLHVSLRKTPYKANRVLQAVSSMFTYAIKHELATENPAQGIEHYPEPQRDHWIQLPELQAMAKALDDYPDQNAADVIRLLVVTGSRKSEVLGAEWNDIDLQHAIWTKPAHTTKERKLEHVPLSSAAMDILLRLRSRSDGRFLFAGVKEGDHRRDLRTVWSYVTKAAGLPSTVRIHDLRHSFASHLVSNGQPLYVVGKLLGHVQASTTQRYAHVAEESLRHSVNAFPQLK